MKVYIITSGCYSDYSIDAVSLDRGEAEKICATLNNNRCMDEFCEIEEYDTEDIKIDTKNEIKTRFRMIVGYKDTEIEMFECPHPVTADVNEISVERYGDGADRIEIIATLPRGMTEDRAKKIMFDRIAKFKSERAGI